MTDKKLSESPQHSPESWEIKEYDEGCQILDSYGNPIIWEEGLIEKKDAQLIVRAVNSHERLSQLNEVAREMAEFIEKQHEDWKGNTIFEAKKLFELARKFQEMNREQD